MFTPSARQHPACCMSFKSNKSECNRHDINTTASISAKTFATLTAVLLRLMGEPELLQITNWHILPSYKWLIYVKDISTLLFSLHISELYYLRWRWTGIGWLLNSSVWPVSGCIWPLSGLFGPLFAYTSSVRPGGLAAGWPLCLDPLESHRLHTGSGGRLRSEPF